MCLTPPPPPKKKSFSDLPTLIFLQGGRKQDYFCFGLIGNTPVSEYINSEHLGLGGGGRGGGG